MKQLAYRIPNLLSVPADNPDLLKAQYRAFSWQLPIMYFILLSSTWALAATHMPIAPLWLTVLVPAVFTALCLVRILYWWRMRRIDPTPERARRALSRTNRLAVVIASAFTLWSFLLFPYGDAYTRSHIAFYMAITVITCIFCLLHLRSAALIVTVIVNGAFVAFFTVTGQPTFLAMAVNIVLVSIGMLVILLVNHRDFTAMVNAETEARRKHDEQSRLLRMIDDMPVAVMTVEPGTLRINYANETSKSLIRSIEHLLPINADSLLGTSIDVFHQHPQHQRNLLADPRNLPHNARIRVGPEVLDLKVSAITASDGGYLGPMLTWAIVTKEVEAESRIRQLAHFDTLTGLANRAAFHERLDAVLGCEVRCACLLFIDLDGFKLVNDTRGHRAGDALLKEVAARLRQACGAPDVVIGRLGGDEFAVLVPGDATDSVERLAVTLIELLALPYPLEAGRQIQIGASVGIALAPLHGTTGEELLAHADMALYAAKAAGKGAFRMYSPDMDARLQDRVRLEASLRRALREKDRLFVFYQPIVDIRSGEVTAREALVRWHHPHKGWVSPAEFIPIAEQSGLIDLLGEFVLDRACRDAAGWTDGARVAVNVSAVQLGKGTLAPMVLAALVGSGLSPERLEIEITETALLDGESDVVGDLRRLRDMGVRVALDDFGTGYSSLAHLRVFPFDKIKIDGSFVRDAVERPDCAAVVRCIADLGKRLGVTTVAEGVETEAHLACVRQEGCTEVQGYIVGRPAPGACDRLTVAALTGEPDRAEQTERIAQSRHRTTLPKSAPSAP
ncbi:bifunctional diguanylate cyclase/phosphodiesterase [Shinella sp. HZN7]|uniref:putative bifunctional diguanylate cyclase/phosphodiesterase n=1 Tax=Shinella sp. (strain HZN7) TaxID=879274 RepID=UPI0009FF51B3|nr:EAL domain-containing protein [Shinella sp. HZN7]